MPLAVAEQLEVEVGDLERAVSDLEAPVDRVTLNHVLVLRRNVEEVQPSDQADAPVVVLGHLQAAGDLAEEEAVVLEHDERDQRGDRLLVRLERDVRDADHEAQSPALLGDAPLLLLGRVGLLGMGRAGDEREEGGENDGAKNRNAPRMVFRAGF